MIDANKAALAELITVLGMSQQSTVQEVEGVLRRQHPIVNIIGKIILNHSTTPAANTGDEPLGYLAQYPDGSGVFYQSKQQAEAHAQKAFTKCVSIPIYAALQRPEPSEGMPYGIIDPDYARVFSMARCLAWSEGYALLFHGSFTRDLDLIAVPWRKEVGDPCHLLQRIRSAADLSFVGENPTEKEHGRLAWTMVFKGFGDPRFIDFSVMQSALASRQVDNPLLPQSIQNAKDTLQYCADELNDAEGAAVSEYANAMSYADLRRIIEAAERNLLAAAPTQDTKEGE